jgi:YD repeat-containing protein
VTASTTRCLAALLACAVLLPTRLLAQPPSIHYVYDDLNRLAAVVDQQGNAATYTYDAVGNILKIERFDATALPGVVAISMFTPAAGRVGAAVQIFGKGFASEIGSTALFFAGHAATVIAAAPNRLVARVPVGATSGPISVTVPLGSATSSRAFQVLGAFDVTPATATLRATARAVFTATESGAPIAARWAVNGLPGGDALAGTIDVEGVYTAPAVVIAPRIVTVTATHPDDAALTVTASVMLLPALSVSLSSRPVSVAAASPPLALHHSVGSIVSVLRSAPRILLGVSTPVSVEIEPVVTAVVPAGATAGETFSVTARGRGLAGAVALVFLRDDLVDHQLRVTNLSVNGDGTQATADVAVDSGAAPGPRVVQVATSIRASSPAGTGGNVFTVQ